MLKDNILEDGMSIISFNIGRLIVIDDERSNTLQRYYLQEHKAVLCNIVSLTANVSRVFNSSFTSILMGQNTDAGWDAPNSTIFATLLSMFSLFDQCAVLMYNKLGKESPDEAVYFGTQSKKTAMEIANQADPTQTALIIFIFGYIIKKRDANNQILHADEEPWHSILTRLRGRIVHRPGVFFKSDLEMISKFIIESAFKKTERDVYLSTYGDKRIYAFDFMCFFLFASEKLTSLSYLVQFVKKLELLTACI